MVMNSHSGPRKGRFSSTLTSSLTLTLPFFWSKRVKRRIPRKKLNAQFFCILLLGYLVATDGHNAVNRNRIAMPSPQMLRIYQNGSYKFAYDTGSGKHQSFRVEVRNAAGSISGRYGYIDPDGVLRVTHYIADARGYRANEVLYKPINQLPSENPLIVGPVPNFRPTPSRPSVFDKLAFPIKPFEDENQTLPLEFVKFRQSHLQESDLPNQPGQVLRTLGVVGTPSGTGSSATFDEEEFGTSDIGDLLSNLMSEEPLLLIGPIPPSLQGLFKPPVPLLQPEEKETLSRDLVRNPAEAPEELQDTADDILRSPDLMMGHFNITKFDGNMEDRPIEFVQNFISTDMKPMPIPQSSLAPKVVKTALPTKSTLPTFPALPTMPDKFDPVLSNVVPEFDPIFNRTAHAVISLDPPMVKPSQKMVEKLDSNTRHQGPNMLSQNSPKHKPSSYTSLVSVSRNNKHMYSYGMESYNKKYQKMINSDHKDEKIAYKINKFPSLMLRDQKVKKNYKNYR